MSQTLAAECRLVIGKFLEAQEANGVLSFRYSLTATSVSEGPSGRAAIRVTFSRPSAASPAPAAVVHVRFLLSETMDQVAGFLLEEDPHVWPTEDVAFDDRTLQRVLDRKLRVRDARFVNVFDDFSSTRVPAAIRETQDRDRQHDRESMEEQLLEYFQRKDPYNDGRLLLTDLVSAIRELDVQVLISGRGRPKLCAEFPKEMFFALAPPADRDELVEYGPLVPLAAGALDSWAGWNYYCQPDATMDSIPESSSTLQRENKDTDETNEESERFMAVNRVHFQYQAQKLREVLETAAATNSAARHPAMNTKAEEVEAFEEAKESDEPTDDSDQQDEHESTASTASLRVEHIPQYVNMRQLQSALELPCLLLSAPEINLILALAVGANSPSGSEEEQFFPVSDIPDLLSRARLIIFSYQYRTFLVADKEGALEQYLVRQFESFERDTLKGSSTHLSGKLTLKQVKQVVREELSRLALSVVQAGQVVAVCDALRHSTDDKVRYRECIAKVASVLRSEVTIEEESDDDHGATSIITREEDIRSACLRVLGSLDDKQLGVLALSTFTEGIQIVADEVGLPICGDYNIKVLTAVADPTGSGRVNYAAFQHQLLPLTIALTKARTKNMRL